VKNEAKLGSIPLLLVGVIGQKQLVLRDVRSPYCQANTKQLLIIFCFELKIGPGMVANGTDLRGFFPVINMPAVPALPGFYFLSLKNLAFFNVLQ